MVKNMIFFAVTVAFCTVHGAELTCENEFPRPQPELMEEFNSFRNSFDAGELAQIRENSKLLKELTQTVNKHLDKLYAIESEAFRLKANLSYKNPDYLEIKDRINKEADEKAMVLLTPSEAGILNRANESLDKVAKIFDKKLKEKPGFSFGATDEVYCDDDNSFCYNSFYQSSGMYSGTFGYTPGYPTVLSSLLALVLSSTDTAGSDRAYIAITKDYADLYWDIFEPEVCKIK